MPNHPLDVVAPRCQSGSPFAHVTPLAPHTVLQEAITSAWRRPEAEAVPWLMAQARLPADASDRVQKHALSLVQALRQRKTASGKAGLVQGLLQEFSLSSQEGIALMCLAEALLRIPDVQTRNALIRDKIGQGDWRAHIGQSASPFVNAAAWGLMLTGKLVSTHSEQGLSAALGRLIGKGGEPLIRKGVDMAMRMMGEQFVTGETMPQALAHAQALEAKGFRYSYDMLGEAAMTAQDALRYLNDYENAIHAIGKASNGRGVYEGPGISIKLSALHPRYSRAQVERVQQELYPVLLRLARLASQYDIGMNIDAEEADRLELSLDLLERLCFEPALQGWKGLGFVIQAYQKRCPFVIDYLIDLARRSGQRLMVRLVKGAYWDSEIKRAQIDGMEDYPVFTRKPYTDLSYIACARRLLAAPAEIYPQFATHNAQTLATIYELAGPDAYHAGQFEFQCLHGMGEPLYEHVVAAGAEGKPGRPCRIYAPVGTHETLLAYLVRRLLENGANTSFVNRVADGSIPAQDLVQDPVQLIEEMAEAEGKPGLPHRGIPLPRELYGALRRNSAGWDLANEQQLGLLVKHLQASAGVDWRAAPMLAEEVEGRQLASGKEAPICNPSNHEDLVGTVCSASPAQVDAAVQVAHLAYPRWAAIPVGERAGLLEGAADRMEAQMPLLMGILVREAGKTYSNAIAEVREAVDFLRYYAAQIRAQFDNATHEPLGPVVCISPWNFPLAIFTGQIAAALAAGNTVLAKPAEQTPLVAAHAVRIFREAGLPHHALQLLPGDGESVGAQLVGDARVQGVMFTGSTEVARILQRTLAQRVGSQGHPVPLIAETGGQNAMIVDSSALTEQVVQDVVVSAFDSAGQRCSALRVLCVQEEAADRLLTMLKGAMAQLSMGDPADLACDVGPVIDGQAREGINRHIATLQAKGRTVHALAFGDADTHQAVMARGTYVMPTLIELPNLADLQREVFGPVLHVVRYQRKHLADILAQIMATGYGLTMGLHTRIDDSIAQVVQAAQVGNLYVNRNTVGAVVGVQPFGGEGLSGTGPKAGGPQYLYRLLAKRPDGALRIPFGVDAATFSKEAQSLVAQTAATQLWAWLQSRPALRPATAPAEICGSGSYVLTGPTGERNIYRIVPRSLVLGLATDARDYVAQLCAALAVGARMLWDGGDAVARSLHASLPRAVQSWVALCDDIDHAAFDAVLLHGDDAALRCVQLRVAQREGPIACVTRLRPGEAAIPLERLVVERALSINTAAAGGNASLMTMT